MEVVSKLEYIDSYGPLVHGAIHYGQHKKNVINPYNKQVIHSIFYADQKLINHAIQTSLSGFNKTRKLSSFERACCLQATANKIEAHKNKLSKLITLSTGKPISNSYQEVDREVYTFNVAAEECKRIPEASIRLDWLPGHEQRYARVIRCPKGIILGITPFNFPLNLVAHKIAPAMASGNSIIIRPASNTAAVAIFLGKLIVDSGWPADGISIIPTTTEDAKLLVEDHRIKHLSFTGSPEIGWSLKTQAKEKVVTLELGGNAGNIIEEDADLMYAVDRIVWGGFMNAGQACISAQRVYIHKNIYSQAKNAIIDKVKSLKVGDPMDIATNVGPVIDKNSADNILNLIENAINNGAEVLCGGYGTNNIIEPTVIEFHDEELEIARQEVFGPVILLSPFTDYKDAIARVNYSKYGLQSGIFTRDAAKIEFAIQELEVGGLNINDVSTFRIDHMPYGGIKGSGLGKEGLKYAIEEMSEMKLITYNPAIFSGAI